MRSCGACRKPLRWDESLSTCLLPALPDREGGFYQACPRCAAQASGDPVPPARKYPPGEVPKHPFRDDYLPICGLCREALFEGERNVPMRLQPEDLEPCDTVEPGAYQACPRCLERWRPVIVQRLIGLGYVPEGTDHRRVGGTMLL